jgi:signal transduction histidine kinase
MPVGWSVTGRAMPTEAKLPEDKVRSLIVWGLSHDYKRVLKTLRKTVREISHAQELERTQDLQFACRVYLKGCDDIEAFLDDMGNTLNRTKNGEDTTPLLQRHTKEIDDLIGRLISGSEKVNLAVDLQPNVQQITKQKAAILNRQTRRAQQQMQALWSMPFGKLAPPISFRVRKEIWRILADLTSLFSANGASIRDNVEINSVEFLNTDRALFSVAVSNIIANAVVHSLRGKDLKITINESVETSAVNARSFLKLSISDNGPGIPVEEREAVFVLFRQGTQTLATESGSGVGLTFAEMAVDLLGGSLILKSAPGQGATFVLKFPTHDARKE